MQATASSFFSNVHNPNVDSKRFSLLSEQSFTMPTFSPPSSSHENATIASSKPRSSFARSRNLDHGLNQSLRHLDLRYVQDTESDENENELSTSFASHYYTLAEDDKSNHPPPSSSSSACLSRTDPFGDDDDVASTWSLPAGSYDGGDNASKDEDDHDDEGDDLDPRTTLFRLLDLHCSVYPSEDGDQHEYERTGSNPNLSAAPSRPTRNDWGPIREWLEGLLPSKGDEDDSSCAAAKDNDPHREAKESILRAAVLEARGPSGQTVLHVACERSVPMDVLELLLSVEVPRNSRDDVEEDGLVVVNGTGLAVCRTIDGWLPLHYACNYPNEYAVVERLVEAFPDAKTHADLKGRTPLHFAMREENMNRPEVVALLVCAAGIADDNGILPLHYACLYGATEDFLRILTEAYPQGIASRDRFGRVPLHYSLSNAGKPNAPDAVRLLLANEPSLVNTPGIARVFSGSDAVRKYAKERETNYRSGSYHESGGSVAKISHPKRYSKNSGGGGAKSATTAATTEAFSCEAVEECLRRFLEAKPNPTADFFMALQSLPEPLREKAVLMRVVQELLNKKIGQRFPTALLLLDLYLQIIVVICYTLVIRNSITWRFQNYYSGFDDDDAPLVGSLSARYTTQQQWICLLALYLALTYFLFREIVQIIGLVSLKASWIWIYEPGNWLNVTYIGVIGTWTILATSGGGDHEVFRNGAALSFAILWLKFLSYLRKILIDFSVFSGGVFHVFRRLLAFLMCLTIILIAFSRMFFALFYETDYCKEAVASETNTMFWELPSGEYDENFTKDLICETNDTKIPWCNEWDSFLAVYTMLLGEVDETVFGDNTTALILFVVFVLLVVILLANVLIAIVADSYKVIRDKRAAIVFWTNRLDFIAQMDAIANGPWKSRLKKFLGLKRHPKLNNRIFRSGSGDILDESYHYVEATFGKGVWNDIVELFEHESLAEDGIGSVDFFLCTMLRLVALLVVPVWILVGALSVGLLWPPQIREKLFVSSITNNQHGSQSEEEEFLRKTQIENLKGEIARLKQDLVRELSQHKTQIVQMKSAVAERKLETLNTLTTIKKNLVLTLELYEIGREE